MKYGYPSENSIRKLPIFTQLLLIMTHQPAPKSSLPTRYAEFEKYRIVHNRLFKSDFDQQVKALESDDKKTRESHDQKYSIKRTWRI